MNSASRLLIRQAQVLLPSGALMIGDVQIEGGTIVQIAPDLSDMINSSGSQEIIDAQGLTLLPGVIDPQVHLKLRGTLATAKLGGEGDRSGS